jgi:ParB-like nuclease domain
VEERQVTTVVLSRVRLVAEAWPRDRLDQERVEDFEALYRAEGAGALPPLELIGDGSGGFILADGVHRREAARAAGLRTLPAFVLTLDPTDDPVAFAYLRALECSAISAKPLTRAAGRDPAPDP